MKMVFDDVYERYRKSMEEGELLMRKEDVLKGGEGRLALVVDCLAMESMNSRGKGEESQTGVKTTSGKWEKD